MDVREGGATGTCNGNGDGIINGWWVTGANHTVEYGYAFKELALAGYIPGSYPGYGWNWITIGTYIPASSYAPYIGYLLYTPVTGSPDNAPLTLRSLFRLAPFL